METTLALPPGVSLGSTLGAVEVGVILSTFLFGVVCSQTYHYFTHYENDNWHLKAIVFVVWCLELGHTVFILHTLWQITVTDFGSLNFLIDSPWTLKGSVVWSGLMNLVVQGFFAYRIKVISHLWTIPILCWFLSVCRLTVLLVVQGFIDRMTLLEFSQRYKYLMTMGLAFGAANDILIACSLSYWLYKKRSGRESSNRVVNRMIIFTIETGILTSILGLAMLITFWALNNYIWAGIMVTIAKFYSNSLLVSLNRRSSYKQELSSTAVSQPSLHLTPGSSRIQSKGNTMVNFPIEMDVRTYVTRDDETSMAKSFSV